METETILVLIGGGIGGFATLAIDHAVTKTRYFSHLRFLHDYDPKSLMEHEYGYHR